MTKKKNETPEEVARRLLRIQPRLHPYLFDEYEQMYEEVRQKILQRLQFFIDMTLKNIPGLEVDDVILNGSAASYCYRDSSDFDIKIMVKNTGNKLIPQDGPHLIEFLNVLKSNYSKYECKLWVDQHFLDIKLSCMNMEIMGLYSILHNKWLLRPDKDILKGITFEKLMAAYYRKMDNLNKYMKTFERHDSKYSLEDCQKMQECYRNLVLGHSREKVIEYLAFKVMSSQRIVRRFNKWVSTEIVRTLCV